MPESALRRLQRSGRARSHDRNHNRNHDRSEDENADPSENQGADPSEDLREDQSQDQHKTWMNRQPSHRAHSCKPDADRAESGVPAS